MYNIIYQLIIPYYLVIIYFGISLWDSFEFLYILLDNTNGYKNHINTNQKMFSFYVLI